MFVPVWTTGGTNRAFASRPGQIRTDADIVTARCPGAAPPITGDVYDSLMPMEKKHRPAAMAGR